MASRIGSSKACRILTILPRQGEVSPKVTEGADAEQGFPFPPPPSGKGQPPPPGGGGLSRGTPVSA